MPFEDTDPRLIFLPEGQCLIARGPCMALHNRFWRFHTGGVLFFDLNAQPPRRHASLHTASPQCHSEEVIAEMLRARFYPWATLRFMPLVLQPIRIGDYA